MDLPGLSFVPGLKIQDEVSHLLGLSVSSQFASISCFALVSSFGRCKFRLSEDSVSNLLQATIGGSAPHFRVYQLDSIVFQVLC